MKPSKHEVMSFAASLAIFIAFIAFTIGPPLLICGSQPHVSNIESASINSEVEGSFALLGGTIGEEQYYLYYVKKESGLILEKSRADTTIIIEEANGNPRIVEKNCDNNKLYVPEGTIVKDYEVKQPGLN